MLFSPGVIEPLLFFSTAGGAAVLSFLVYSYILGVLANSGLSKRPVVFFIISLFGAALASLLAYGIWWSLALLVIATRSNSLFVAVVALLTISCLFGFVLLIAYLLQLRHRKRSRSNNPKPQLWLQDLIVATLCYGIMLIVVRQTHFNLSFFDFGIPRGILRFPILAALGTWIAVYVCRSAIIKPWLRAGVVASVVAATMSLPFVPIIAYFGWHRVLNAQSRCEK